MNKRIEYKPLSLTYKVLTPSQPDYLHNPRPRQSFEADDKILLSRPEVNMM